MDGKRTPFNTLTAACERWCQPQNHASISSDGVIVQGKNCRLNATNLLCQDRMGIRLQNDFYKFLQLRRQQLQVRLQPSWQWLRVWLHRLLYSDKQHEFDYNDSNFVSRRVQVRLTISLRQPRAFPLAVHQLPRERKTYSWPQLQGRARTHSFWTKIMRKFREKTIVLSAEECRWKPVSRVLKRRPRAAFFYWKNFFYSACQQMIFMAVHVQATLFAQRRNFVII